MPTIGDTVPSRAYAIPIIFKKKKLFQKTKIGKKCVQAKLISGFFTVLTLNPYLYENLLNYYLGVHVYPTKKGHIIEGMKGKKIL